MNITDFLYGVGFTVAMFALGAVLQMVIGVVKFLRTQKKFPMAVLADESQMCSKHQWGSIFLAVKKLPPDNYTVCTECGFVSGTEYQLNQPGIEAYQESLSNKEKIQALLDQKRKFLDMELEHAKKIWIRQNLDRFMDVSQMDELDAKNHVHDLLVSHFDYAVKKHDDALDRITESVTSKYNDIVENSSDHISYDIRKADK